MYSSRRYYFLALAETCNVTHAAQQIRISQPSLTQYLNRLETELRVKLFDRSYSPMRLTEAGRIYYEYLKATYSMDQKLMSDLKPFQPEEHMLRIGLPTQRSRDVTRLFMRQFLRSYPDILLSTWEGTSKEVRDSLVKDQIDIGFCHVSDPDIPGCEVAPIFEEQILLVCNRENPLLHGAQTTKEHPLEVSAHSLSEQTLFQMADGFLLRELSDRYLSAYDVYPKKRITISVVLSVIDTICIEKENGIAFIADYFLDDPYVEDKLDDLAFIRLGEHNISWCFALIRRRGSFVSPEAKRFWTHAVKACAEVKKQ